jgi:hypothetical protein
VHIHSLYALASVVILLAIGPSFALCQSTNAIDIPVPSSFAIHNITAIGNGSTTVGIWSDINVTSYGGSVYVTIPTNASDGVTLLYFQDTGSRVLFQNDTMTLPIRSASVQSASLVLATSDLASSGGLFYGQVAGIELDTAALSYGNVSDDAVIYLNSLPAGASYRLSVSDDKQVKDAIMAEASQDGASGTIGYPMIGIAGTSNGSQDSIGYVILRMKEGSQPVSGNVTAYRYNDGATSILPCTVITSVDGTFYEAISPGPGVFAFIGDFPGSPLAGPGLDSILEFSGLLTAILLTLVSITLLAFKKMGNNKN